MMDKDYHVIAGMNGGWKVIRRGSSRAAKTFKTQDEAIDYGKAISHNHRTDLIIHGPDGRLQKRESYLTDPQATKR
jgi:hypothetical protein